MESALLYVIVICLIIIISSYYSMILSINKKEGRILSPIRKHTQEHIITNKWYDVTILEKSFKEYVYILSQRNDYFKYYKNARYGISLVYKDKTHHIIIDTTMLPAKDFVKEFNDIITLEIRKSLDKLGIDDVVSDDSIPLKLTSTILDYNYSD